jgi:hypothetical protein
MLTDQRTYVALRACGVHAAHGQRRNNVPITTNVAVIAYIQFKSAFRYVHVCESLATK